MKFIALCLVLLLVLSGCRPADKPFILPLNYTGQALVKVYTDQTENEYKVNLVCRDGNYSIMTQGENAAWNYALISGKRCILSNDKFTDSSVTIENFKLGRQIYHDFDFRKFHKLEELPQELIYFDGTYKHVLNFSKENFLPETINIYKNEKLVKAIEYEILNIEE